MFEINNYKFLDYNIRDKIDREDVGKKRFEKFKEKINEFNKKNIEGGYNLSLKIEKGEDATIYCNDIKNLKIFLDNISTKSQKYFLSRGYRKIRIFNTNNNVSDEKKFFKELYINMLAWGLFPKEITKIKNYFEKFNFENFKDEKTFNFLIFNSLINTLEDCVIFFLNLYPPEKLFETKKFKKFEEKNIILYLTTDKNFQKKCNFIKRISFEIIDNKLKNIPVDDENEDEDNYLN